MLADLAILIEVVAKVVFYLITYGVTLFFLIGFAIYAFLSWRDTQ